MEYLPERGLLDTKDQEPFLKNLLDVNSNETVKGFPGSGKTVLLVYAVQKIRELNPTSRILFIEFTHALIKMLEADLNELSYEGKEENPVKVVTYYDFEDHYSAPKSWDYIICDEVQDIPSRYLSLMKSAAHRVIVGGDANQSIYEVDPKRFLPTCTPEDIQSILNPHTTTLHIIHRLGKHVANAVHAVLPSMNILAGRPNMMKSSMQIRIWKAADEAQEVKLIMNEAKEAIEFAHKTVGILLPVHDKILKFLSLALIQFDCKPWDVTYKKFGSRTGGPDYNSFNEYAEQHHVPIQVVANGAGDFLKHDVITVTTYHSSKGLDFDHVFLPFCNKASNQVESDARLLMVAMTRCRAELYITYTYSLNELLLNINKEDYTYKDWSPSLFPTEEDKTGDTTNIFGF